ncbi:MAG: prepilin-type cleavage/methylation domain-containing protein, partial [Deltaproteobacteria bacterium]|nr:prepilin-type cleavage/methylation domain-containing protein [Deltaproteobacteria bacterium]
WGNPYQYNDLNNIPPGLWRKDKNLVPLNSDYDLWSNGKDGKTNVALTAKASYDDIIRANDGAYIGLATGY